MQVQSFSNGQWIDTKRTIPNSLIRIGFDIEGTGQSMTDHAMIELAGVVMDRKGVVITTFTTMMKIPLGKGWEERCVREFWDSSEMLREKKRLIDMGIGMEPADAMPEFLEWLEQFRGSMITWVSDFCAYDIAWINYYLALYADSLPLQSMFGYNPPVDLTGFYMGLLGMSDKRAMIVKEELKKEGKKFSKKGQVIEKFLKIDEGKLIDLFKEKNEDSGVEVVHDHNAINDAAHMIFVYTLVTRMLDETPIARSIE